MDYKPMMCLTEFDVESAIKTWREDGYDEGKADGKQEKAVEDARNLLCLRLGTVQQIAQAIGLSLEEVQKLAEEIGETTE